jgi:hypothetical protein
MSRFCMLPPALLLESNRIYCVFSAIAPYIYRGAHRPEIRRRPRYLLRVGTCYDLCRNLIYKNVLSFILRPAVGYYHRTFTECLPGNIAFNSLLFSSNTAKDNLGSPRQKNQPAAVLGVVS